MDKHRGPIGTTASAGYLKHFGKIGPMENKGPIGICGHGYSLESKEPIGPISLILSIKNGFISLLRKLGIKIL